LLDGPFQRRGIPFSVVMLSYGSIKSSTWPTMHSALCSTRETWTWSVRRCMSHVERLQLRRATGWRLLNPQKSGTIWAILGACKQSTSRRKRTLQWMCSLSG
ncbi:hypothetical protein PMAYCL1PPCAC_04687, partial [Pristionchus mayeri]